MSWIRSNSSLAEVGSHWKRTATSVTATPITMPIATSWTIPLRTAAEPTSTRELSWGRNRIRLSVSLSCLESQSSHSFSSRSRSPPRRCLGTLVAGRGEASTTEPGAVARDKPVVLAFGGDVHFEGVLESKLASSPAGLLAPIEPVLDERRPRRREPRDSGHERRLAGGEAVRRSARPRTRSRRFAGGGVDVASMANNHGLDFGEAGLRDSLAAAQRAPVPGRSASVSTASRRTGRFAARSTASGSRSSARRRSSTTT